MITNYVKKVKFNCLAPKLDPLKPMAMVTRLVSKRHSGIMGNCNISCWKGVCQTGGLNSPVVYRPRVFLFAHLFEMRSGYAGSISKKD